MNEMFLGASGQHADSSALDKLSVSRGEAAELTTLSIRTIDTLIASGDLVASKIGRRVLVELRSIRTLLRRKSMKATEVQRGN